MDDNNHNDKSTISEISSPYDKRRSPGIKTQKPLKSPSQAKNKNTTTIITTTTMNVVEESESVPQSESESLSKRQRVEQGKEKLQIFKQGEDDDKAAFAVVTEALRTFYKYYLHFVQVYLFVSFFSCWILHLFYSFS